MPKLTPKYRELRGRVFMVDPRELVVDLERNARRYMPQDVQDLAVSMAENDQLQDVMVRRTGDGKFTVVAGNLRTLAGRFLIEQKLKEDFQLRCCLVDSGDAKAFVQSIVENLDRTDVSIIDTAHNIRRLMDLTGKSQTEVASLYHKSASWISQTLLLLTLPARMQRAVHDGEISAESACLDARRSLREMPVPNGTAAGPHIAAVQPNESPTSGSDQNSSIDNKALSQQESSGPELIEKKVEESDPTPLTRKEIARFWEEMAKDVPEGQKPKPINRFAQVVVKWMAGTKGYGERKMKSVLEDVRYFGKG
jgi:ParB/RepB/Spo0J family partition protein